MEKREDGTPTGLNDAERAMHFPRAQAILSEDRYEVITFVEQTVDKIIALARALNYEQTLPTNPLGVLDRATLREKVWDYAIIATTRALSLKVGEESPAATLEFGIASAGFGEGSFGVTITADARAGRNKNKDEQFSEPDADLEISLGAYFTLGHLNVRVNNADKVPQPQREPVAA
jgi:hypothetical protein